MSPTGRGRILGFAEGDAVVQRPGGELVVVSLAARTALNVGDLVSWSDEEVERIFVHPDGAFPPTPSADAGLLEPSRWRTLRQRAAIIADIRGFFCDRAFLEVETPLIVDSPGTEVHLAPVAVTHRPRPGAAPSLRYLITSPEYHMKRLIAFGAPNIFQLSKVFRDAEQGHQHRSEFTMLEWYRPYATLEDIAADCEGLLSALVPKGHLSYQDADIDLSPPFPRRPFYELLRDRGGVREPERLTHDEALEAFVEHVERTLGHAHPEFVVDYPASMASLARTKRGAPHLAERLELYISGIELANGFDELTDAEEQRRRCAEDNAQRKALDLPSIPMDEDFLDALTQGMPPSAGIALGVDRLVMLLTDSAHIDDVLTF